MKTLALIVDELPETCQVCIFRPEEEVGRLGNIVNTYCQILHKIMAEGKRRDDCPLIEVEPDYVDIGA